MLKEVGEGGGWGIAFKAKKKVQRMVSILDSMDGWILADGFQAPQKLNSDSLADLLYLFGYSEKEIGALTGSR